MKFSLIAVQVALYELLVLVSDVTPGGLDEGATIGQVLQFRDAFNGIDGEIQRKDVRGMLFALAAKDDVVEVFRKLDTKCKGSFTAKQLWKVLRANFGVVVTESFAEKMIQLFHVSNDGSVGYKEYLKLMLEEKHVDTSDQSTQ